MVLWLLHILQCQHLQSRGTQNKGHESSAKHAAKVSMGLNNSKDIVKQVIARLINLNLTGYSAIKVDNSSFLLIVHTKDDNCEHWTWKSIRLILSWKKITYRDAYEKGQQTPVLVLAIFLLYWRLFEVVKAHVLT